METSVHPCITLYSRKSDLTFILGRRQFPVRLAFAMTINKSQGQSVKHVDLCSISTRGSRDSDSECSVSRSATDIVLRIYVHLDIK